MQVPLPTHLPRPFCQPCTHLTTLLLGAAGSDTLLALLAPSLPPCF